MPGGKQVAFNLLALGNDIGGIDRYSFSLISTLAGQVPGREFLVFLGDACRLKFPQGNIREIRIGFRSQSPLFRRFAEVILLKNALRKRAFSGILHSVNNVAPIVSGVDHVVTIHDLLWKIDPKRFPLAKRMFLRIMVPRSLFRAKKIISVSQSTKGDIIRFFSTPEKKITVIPEATPLEISNRLGSFSSIVAKTEKSAPYLLFVGRLEAGKNVHGLIEAFLAAEKQGMKGITLKIVGASAWKSDYDARLEKYRAHGNIEFLGSVSDSDLAGLYKNALGFVYPSFYEGFGLPVLEAMEAGTPVITSNCSSLPEVSGSAALLCDPADRAGLAGCILRLAKEPELRQTLINLGFAQAKQFSWDQAARRTWQLYQDLAGEGPA